VFRQTPHRLEDGRIVLSDVTALSDDRVRRWLDFASVRQRAFPADTDVGGFNIGEFDAFWRALYAWSVCVTSIYSDSCGRRRIPQEQSMPTQVVRSGEFIRSMATLSGLPAVTVESILVSLAISNARNSRAAAMLEVKSSFSRELGPCVAENRVRSKSLLTIYRSFSRSLTARSGLGIKSSAPAFSWGLRAEPGPKSWPS